ncbi:hypothetical protein H072_8204 [Dactylellina haptotyla CBS 200.50]|uniref:Inositolphosphorylceramide synthase subunit Kei1-domain-containing protein n=1 Tax=Dactylellina haptotyla (strain CBS 200.50) TaxID=1284197 RepID=S8A5J4_DACHA|nr:hypothetical protein H072_8204 [Dactylellina haptotyla CBS 200.50]
MLSLSRILLPRPRHFLGFLDLRIGAELILLCSLFNKASGFYGLLAIFTGAEISALQISMYVYSVLAVFFIAWVQPHIRKRTPFPVISFSYWYLIDSIINATYTTIFAITWFMVISEPRRSQTFTAANTAPGVGNSGKMIEDISGLSGGPFNPNGGPDGTDTPAPSYIETMADGLGIGVFGSGLSQPESMTSLSIILGLWIIRSYFCLVVLAYARQVVRESATPATPPFSGKNGEGFQGSLGRRMININRRYWEGPIGWSTRLPAPPQAQTRKFRKSLEENRKKSDIVV